MPFRGFNRGGIQGRERVDERCPCCDVETFVGPIRQELRQLVVALAADNWMAPRQKLPCERQEERPRRHAKLTGGAADCVKGLCEL